MRSMPSRPTTTTAAVAWSRPVDAGAPCLQSPNVMMCETHNTRQSSLQGHVVHATHCTTLGVPHTVCNSRHACLHCSIFTANLSLTQTHTLSLSLALPRFLNPSSFPIPVLLCTSVRSPSRSSAVAAPAPQWSTLHRDANRSLAALRQQYTASRARVAQLEDALSTCDGDIAQLRAQVANIRVRVLHLPRTSLSPPLLAGYCW